MANSLTILEESGGVAVLTLNRPEKRNALSRALRDEIVVVARELGLPECRETLAVEVEAQDARRLREGVEGEERLG